MHVNRPSVLTKIRVALCVLAVLIGSLMVLTGCEGDDSSAPAGTSRIQGNVNAPAVAGVMVSMPGTTLRTTTDSDGNFTMTGVPAGHRQMRFDNGGTVSTLDVDVPADGTLVLDDVRCGGGPASVGHTSARMNSHMNSMM